MTDLLFGSFPTPSAADPQRVVALAQLAEQVGLDLVSLQDHPYQARYLDTWTLLSVIGAHTSTIRLATNVANLPLRPPAVLAKAAASLDLLTGGRVELGLGAGGFREAVTAYGGPTLTAGESVTALEEAIAVIRAVWTPGPAARAGGRFHRLAGAHPGPAPAHPIGIWLGAYRPRMLALTGRLADGWLPSSPYAPPEELPALAAAVGAAAEDAGRDPRAIRRLYNVAGSFTGTGRDFLQGPAEVWIEQLAELVLDVGMDGFVVVGNDPDLVRRYAGEVAPGVRELVAAERSGVATGSPTAVPPPAAQSPVVAPTPDGGVRRGTARVWDEADRPTGPAPDPDRTYTPAEQATGRHLVEVHDHLRAELDRVRDLVDQVGAGSLDVGAARSHLQDLTLRQNDWTLGAYCAAYCRLVTTHHTLETDSVFPHLRRHDAALGPVLDRLDLEHVVIHDVIDGVDRALVAYVRGDVDLAGVHAAVDRLTDALLSHLAYEERELVEPLSRLGFF